MEQDKELKRLEKFVENLLTRFTELRAEKAALLQEIRDRDAVIEELQDNVSTKDTERSEISLRVGKIVQQIEEWEQSLDESEFEDISQEGGSADSEVEKAVEEETSPAEESDSDESNEAEEERSEEGRGQQNLFSIETS